MPRGGHFGLWKPAPSDIFRSRWKRFYKETNRLGASANNNFPLGLGFKARYPPKDVQGFWKLGYYVDRDPPDPLKEIYLQPARLCRNPKAMPAILRALEGRLHGGAETGIGHPDLSFFKGKGDMETELKTLLPAHMQRHLETLVKCPKQGESPQESDFYVKVLSGQPERFACRKMEALRDEYNVVWRGGSTARKAVQEASSARGNFPYIEEQASLLRELSITQVVRIHRTNLRRHPKWREIEYEFKKGHRNYLRRRDVMLKEQKASMGIITGLTQ